MPVQDEPANAGCGFSVPSIGMMLGLWVAFAAIVAGFYMIGRYLL